MDKIFIDTERVKTVTAYFWSRLGTLTSQDVGAIDGTFIDECCFHRLSNGDIHDLHYFPDGRPINPKRPVKVSNYHCSEPRLVSPSSSDQIVHPLTVPASLVRFAIHDRRWDGQRVERHVASSLLTKAYMPRFSRAAEDVVPLPLGKVIGPWLSLVDEDGYLVEGQDQASAVQVDVVVHTSESGLPPKGLIADTYDLIAVRGGWTNRLPGEVKVEQQPSVAIRTWCIGLLHSRYGAAMKPSRAASVFEDVARAVERDYEYTFSDANWSRQLNALRDRVADARALIPRDAR